MTAARRKLLGQLQRRLAKGTLRTDERTLQRHAGDKWFATNPPDAVAFPRSAKAVAEILKFANRHRIPVTARGSGFGYVGGCVPVRGGIALSLAKMKRIREISASDFVAVVQPGVITAELQDASEAKGLYYPPDPASRADCSIGGNIATNSGGPHTLKNGVTTNHVLGYEMILPDGTIEWLGAEPDGGEEVGGYDLRGAAIGSEGMFGVVTTVLVRLMKTPPAFKTFLGVFESVDEASQAVSGIIAAGIVPAALEMMDQLITQALEEAYHFGFPLDAGAVLIVELDGLAKGIEQQAKRVEEICRRNNAREVRLAKDAAERAALWKCRKQAFGAIGRLSPNYVTQDGVVPRSKLPEIMRFIRTVSDKYELRIPNVFHAGDGNIHPLILYDERKPGQVKRALQAGHDILGKCIELGGSVTGEHGIGAEKIDFMAKQFSKDDLDAMQQLRRVFDPKKRCNPHKMFPGAKRCAEFAQRAQITA